jgi:hypothetical protein
VTDQRLEELFTRQEIVDCLHRYTRGIDRHDDELLLSVFHPDAVVNFGAFQGSPQEFIEWSARLHDEKWSGHTHLIDTNYIDIDGDSAHTETKIYFVHRSSDGERIEFGGGRYIDRFQREFGVWRISARRLLIEWTAVAPQAVFADVADYPPGKWDRSDPSYARPFLIGD